MSVGFDLPAEGKTSDLVIAMKVSCLVILFVLIIARKEFRFVAKLKRGSWRIVANNFDVSGF
jgi:hypothetical protein